MTKDELAKLKTYIDAKVAYEVKLAVDELEQSDYPYPVRRELDGAEEGLMSIETTD